MNANEKKCPYCAEIIKAKAIKCKFCKSEQDSGFVSLNSLTSKSKFITGNKYTFKALFIFILLVMILYILVDFYLNEKSKSKISANNVSDVVDTTKNHLENDGMPKIVKDYIFEKYQYSESDVVLQIDDINNDDLKDIIVTNVGEDCNAHGCNYMIFMNNSNGYTLSYEGKAHQIKINKADKTLTILEVEGSGLGCDRATLEICTTKILWDGNSFVAISKK